MSLVDSERNMSEYKAKSIIYDMLIDHLNKYGSTVVDIWLIDHYPLEKIIEEVYMKSRLKITIKKIEEPMPKGGYAAYDPRFYTWYKAEVVKKRNM